MSVAIYSKRMNGKQRACAKKYEDLCGFEFMHQDDIDAGKMKFNEAWWINLKWLEDVLADVQNINTTGACKFDG